MAAIGQTLAQMDLFAEHGFAFDDGLFAAGDLIDDVDDLLRIFGKICVAVVALDGIHRLRHQFAPVLVGVLLDLLHFLGQRWCVRITLQGFSEILAIGRDGAGDRCADAFVLAGFVDVLGVGIDIFFDRTHSLYPFARNSTKSMISMCVAVLQPLSAERQYGQLKSAIWAPVSASSLARFWLILCESSA